jgi:hypothetical protein
MGQHVGYELGHVRDLCTVTTFARGSVSHSYKFVERAGNIPEVF